MQTFLPYPDYARSAAALDYRRLGKQRVEAKQLYLALTQSNYGWAHHPAAKMWRGHLSSLLDYGVAICEEWRSRGYRDTLLDWFTSQAYTPDTRLPDWLTEEFCRAHQSNLVRKAPEHYRPLFPDVPDNLPYIWPVA